MKDSEAALLLAAIARTDRRTFGEAESISWAGIMTKADVPLSDAIAAAQEHFGESHDYLMPIHIIDRVKRIRRERLTRAGDPPMPGDLSWQQEKEWRQLWCAKVKDGATRDQAAAEASIAMRIHELPAVEDATRVRAIEAFAGRTPRPKPEKPKRKRVEYVDDTPAAS